MLNGIFGGLGDGKTLLQTLITLDIAKNRSDYEIYSNYNIKNDRVHIITPLELIDINPETNRALINLDEAYAWLESRCSMSAVNRILSWIILQSRKRNMDICYTAQLTSTVDLRLRNLTDLAFVCEKTENGFKYKLFWQRGLRMRTRKFFLPFQNAEKIYPLYDTREIVKPIGLEKIKEDLKAQDLDLETEIETLTKQITPMVRGMKLTRATIEYSLLKLHKPLKYASLIQTALNMKGVGKIWVKERE